MIFINCSNSGSPRFIIRGHAINLIRLGLLNLLTQQDTFLEPDQESVYLLDCALPLYYTIQTPSFKGLLILTFTEELEILVIP